MGKATGVIRLPRGGGNGLGLPGFGVARYPLGPAQKRFWFLDRYDDESGSYNIARATRLRGTLDIAALRYAHEAVAGRHEILRTRYPLLRDMPVQVIDPPGPVDFDEIDLSTLSADQCDAALAAYLEQEARRPFDLARGPVWRVRVARFDRDDHVLLTVIHHIAADGWSFPRLRSEVSALYRSMLQGTGADLPDLPAQYRHYVQRQIAAQEERTYIASAEFWKRRFGGDPDPLPFLSDRPRPRHRTSRGDWIDLSLPGTTESALRDRALSLDATPFMVALALFGAFLCRFAGTGQVVVGIPSIERTWPPAQHLIGPFVNSLPIRVSLPAGVTLRELVASVRTEVLDALDHAEVPFEEIVRIAKPRRDPSHTPLFQVMFQYRDGTFRSDLELPGVSEEVLRIGGSSSKFDLVLELGGVEGPVTGSLNYSSDLFDRETVERLASAFSVMSEAAISDPDLPIQRLPLVTGWERLWLLRDLNDTAFPYPAEASLPELYRQIVALHGEAPAVEDGELRLTHGQLRAGALLIAEQLRDAGVEPGDRVGLRLPRSATMIAASLAVMELGAIYVPLDPGYPEARIRHMIDIAGIQVVIGAAGKGSWSDVAITPTGHQGRSLDVSPRPAYVMFTSGSTGVPKGVLVPQRAIVRLVCNTDYIDLSPGDVVAHGSNVSFDASTFEIWGALLNGATLTVFDPGTVLDPPRMAEALRQSSVSTVFVTTALFNVIARHAPAAFATVRHVLFGGERCDPAAVRAVLRAGAPERLLHMYGPTETTTFASWFEVDNQSAGAQSIPIGFPIANTTLHVLDPEGGLLPPGLVGELYIGGDGVARGYLGDPELTDARFVLDPFSDDPSGRLYRTGDLVKRLPDGAIEFVGRTDRQLKLRGFRIEPEEIEGVLRRHPDVAAAIAGIVAVGGEPQLAAWVVPHRSGAISVSQLRGHLEADLPSFMVPAFVTIVAVLPVGPNGKIDIDRLPMPLAVPEATSPAATRTEERMVRIFSDVLGVDGVDHFHSFFDLGGHSLLAVELIAAIDREFGLRLPLSSLFNAPTPAALATLIERGEPGTLEEALVLLKDGGPRPPVFLFHHPSGSVLAYEPLARHLGPDQPVYGIQARGVDGAAKPYGTIEEMAVQYADLIERTDQSGGYRLVGHSLGGLLAWETARMLRRRGHEVAMLALLDSFMPRRGWWRRGVVDGHPRTGSPVFRALRRSAGDIRWGTRWAWYSARGKPIPPELARVRLIRASSRAFDRYLPPPFDGNVTYLAATENGGATARSKGDDWARLCTKLEVVAVPGNHTGPDSLLAEPNVPILGIELRNRLALLAEMEGSLR